MRISRQKYENLPSISPFEYLTVLQETEISKLISNFTLNQSETKNLLDFLAWKNSKILSRLNQRGNVQIQVWCKDQKISGYCSLIGSGKSSNYKLRIRDTEVAIIPTRHHLEFKALIESGLPFTCELLGDSKLQIFLEHI